jgi:hypothetical protein
MLTTRPLKPLTMYQESLNLGNDYETGLDNREKVMAQNMYNYIQQTFI